MIYLICLSIAYIIQVPLSYYFIRLAYYYDFEKSFNKKWKIHHRIKTILASFFPLMIIIAFTLYACSTSRPKLIYFDWLNNWLNKEVRW